MIVDGHDRPCIRGVGRTDHSPRLANSKTGELLELALAEDDATKSARKVKNSRLYPRYFYIPEY